MELKQRAAWFLLVADPQQRQRKLPVIILATTHEAFYLLQVIDEPMLRRVLGFAAWKLISRLSKKS